MKEARDVTGEFAHNEIAVDHMWYILHDCIADGASCADGQLTFFFSDGIWLSPEHEANDTGRPLRTDEAAVSFFLECGDVGLAHAFVFDGDYFRSSRTPIEAPELVELVSAGEIKLWFVTRWFPEDTQDRLRVECRALRGGDSGFGDGYGRECELDICVEKTVYRWGKVRFNRRW